MKQQYVQAVGLTLLLLHSHNNKVTITFWLAKSIMHVVALIIDQALYIIAVTLCVELLRGWGGFCLSLSGTLGFLSTSGLLRTTGMNV